MVKRQTEASFCKCYLKHNYIRLKLTLAFQFVAAFILNTLKLLASIHAVYMNTTKL